MRGRRRGFTLIEAVLALALAGLLALGGAQAFQGLAPRMRLRSAVWEVTSGLGQARFGAIMSGEAVRVRFVPAGFALERRGGEAGVWRTSSMTYLEGVSVRANNAPIFYPQGTVSGLATITVSNAKGGYRITVAITGRIRAVRTG